jgi:hypothetical protein
VAQLALGGGEGMQGPSDLASACFSMRVMLLSPSMVANRQAAISIGVPSTMRPRRTCRWT